MPCRDLGATPHSDTWPIMCLAGCDSGSVRIWDLRTRQTLRTLQHCSKGPVTNLVSLSMPPALMSRLQSSQPSTSGQLSLDKSGASDFDFHLSKADIHGPQQWRHHRGLALSGLPVLLQPFHAEPLRVDGRLPLLQRLLLAMCMLLHTCSCPLKANACESWGMCRCTAAAGATGKASGRHPVRVCDLGGSLSAAAAQ